ncbi:hypothetical protein Tco_1355462 [Tanacetum coccineum]
MYRAQERIEECVCTRPNIAYAVSIVSMYLANLGLVYSRDQGNHVDVYGFVDADYAKDPDKEAEYMALTEAVKESIWLKGLLIEQLVLDLFRDLAFRDRASVCCRNRTTSGIRATGYCGLEVRWLVREFEQGN